MTSGAERHAARGPFPYGYFASIISGSTVAAPLLAGFSFSLLALVVSAPENLRYPTASETCFVVAGAAFIAAVQCGYSAQQWVFAPGDAEAWNPAASEAWRESIERLHTAAFHLWAGRFRVFFRIGTLALFAGLVLALIPESSLTWQRAVPILAMAIGLAGEIAWICANWLLLGSPTGTWAGEPDEPAGSVRLATVRRSPRLRRGARRIVPLVRVPGPPRAK